MSENKELLESLAVGLLVELNGINDPSFRRKTAQRYILKYHKEMSEKMTIEDKIESIVDSYHEVAFKKFWDIYNKKVQYAPTLKKWMNLKKADVEVILESVSAFVEAWPDRQYRPNPLTYLNQRRWEDELPNRKPKRTINVEVKQNTWSYGNK